MNKPLTWLEINKSAINYNISQFRKLIGPDKLLMSVIKSNAYGHGFFEVAQICDKNKDVDRICVVSLEEALKLIDFKIKKPIFVLSFYELDRNLLKKAIKNKVIFALYDLQQAQILNDIAKHLNKTVKIHLEIDTGASRTGIMPQDTLSFIEKLKPYQNLILEGIWSHFASSEDNPQYTYYQLKKFKNLIKQLESQKIHIPLKHFACTASSVLYKESLLNGIRLGIGLYGLYDNEKIAQRINLKPALFWYTTILQIKDLPPKTKIGYGGTYTTKKKTNLAIIPVGYWDGYDRLFSNRAQVIIKGKKCPIRGRICMNLSMVDITKVPNAKVGDKVILIGKSKNQIISANDLASWANTINYEIVTRINPWLPRILT
ncbi:MAG: alanine racemase [Parcubacteria group bacterium]|nr:alanine racemase [Parcubacteria group bacterium]